MSTNELPEKATESTPAQVQPEQNASALAERMFGLVQREAKAWASADMVPDSYRGNVANCIIAIDAARRLNISPLQVMQHLYVVHGKPGWSSTFLIGAVNASGKFSPLRYETRGEEGKPDFAMRAHAVEKATGEVLHGTWITAAMVTAEGWSKKSGSKWLTMPEQMYRYRAAAFWQRAYAPEISMGFLTAEEVADIAQATAPTGTTTIRLSPAQMARAKKDLSENPEAVEDLRTKAAGIAMDQAAELFSAAGIDLETPDK